MADHDHAYKLLFSHAEMVADLLRGFVHEDWVDDLDFSTLEKVDASFISDGLQAREGDIVWRLRWGRERWLYVYLLLEFQSTVDAFMAVRVMTYLGLLYQELIREKLLTPEGRLPPVLPMVLYNGVPAWGAAQDVAELVGPVPGGLDRYRPRCRYLLLDEGRIAESELASLRNLAAALFRLETSRGPDEVQRVVAALLQWLRGPEQAELRRAFGTWLSQVLLPARLPGVTVPGVMDLKEVKSMLAERVMEWTRQWEQEGFQKGLKEAREKDLEEARSALLEAIEQRFGPIPEVIRQRIAAMGSPREIVLATVRAATAPSLDALGIS
ncbi:MAG TPA: Rpn family recombination-promoting nuclease/putative transposase [Thermoanaerobaculia bacterium]|nr:Rpn family recombination-promoting nuclease/putative transposase [Thermoanaerobaculia bacterium]